MIGRPLKKIECGAYARSTKLPCRAKALDNGKCRMHGGLSVGAVTTEGHLTSLSNLKNVGDKIATDDSYKQKLINKHKERHYV